DLGGRLPGPSWRHFALGRHPGPGQGAGEVETLRAFGAALPADRPATAFGGGREGVLPNRLAASLSERGRHPVRSSALRGKTVAARPCGRNRITQGGEIWPAISDISPFRRSSAPPMAAWAFGTGTWIGVLPFWGPG